MRGAKQGEKRGKNLNTLEEDLKIQCHATGTIFTHHLGCTYSMEHVIGFTVLEPMKYGSCPHIL